MPSSPSVLVIPVLTVVSCLFWLIAVGLATAGTVSAFSDGPGTRWFTVWAVLLTGAAVSTTIAATLTRMVPQVVAAVDLRMQMHERGRLLTDDEAERRRNSSPGAHLRSLH